jgi:hypothetical protein
MTAVVPWRSGLVVAAAVAGSLVMAGCGGGANNGVGEGSSASTSGARAGSGATSGAASGSASAGESSGRTSTPAAASTKALPLATVCSQLKETLATGPSATKNPLGAAKAQIVPLTRVQSSDGALLSVLRTLVNADDALIRAKGHDATALSQIASAKRSLAAICPGVRS